MGFHLYNGSKGGTYLLKHVEAAADTVWQRIAVIKPAMVAIAMSFKEQGVQRSLADFRADLELAFKDPEHPSRTRSITGPTKQGAPGPAR